MALDLIKNILNDEFLESLAKSADLYKIGTNTVLDPEEIRIGLKVVPRAVMSMLISELAPMEINAHKDVQLPFGKEAYIRVNKNAADDFTGSIYSDNKLVYDFKNRSIPGLGIILLSTFELYNMEDLHKPQGHEEDVDRKIQRMIDERMELHSLVGKVVEEKLAQREAIHKIMMGKLSEALNPAVSRSIPQYPAKTLDIKPGDIVKKELEKATTGRHGGASAISGHEKGVHIPTVATPGMSTMGSHVRYPSESGTGSKEMARRHAESVLKEMKYKPKPNLPKSEEMSQKEKGSPLKKFLDNRKKPKEHRIEMTKSETVNCPDCGQTIFGNSGFSGCICYGPDQHRKIWLKKTEDGVQIKFSRGWDPDNISQLLETLRKNNGKN